MLVEKVQNKKPPRYSQVMQAQHVEFTFARKEGNKIIELFHPFICRDYFNDILYCQESGEKINEDTGGIYGFTYDPAKTPIDEDATRLSIKFSGDMRQNLITNIGIIHQIEKDNEFKPTEFHIADNNYLLVEGDSKWMKANFLMSLYTYLIKCASHNIANISNWEDDMVNIYANGVNQTREGSYMKGCGIPKFKFLTRKLNEIIDPFKGTVGFKEGIHSVHDFSGWLSTFNGGPFIIDQLKSTYAKKALNLWTSSNFSTNTSAPKM